MSGIALWPKIFKTIKRNIFSQKFEPEVFFLKKFIADDSVCLDVDRIPHTGRIPDAVRKGGIKK